MYSIITECLKYKSYDESINDGEREFEYLNI